MLKKDSYTTHPVESRTRRLTSGDLTIKIVRFCGLKMRDIESACNPGIILRVTELRSIVNSISPLPVVWGLETIESFKDISIPAIAEGCKNGCRKNV